MFTFIGWVDVSPNAELLVFSKVAFVEDHLHVSTVIISL